MAFTPSNLEQNNSEEFLRNWQHASRIFVDDQFRLLPKADFSFHVAININTNAVRDQQLLQNHRNEINLLVKTATLPKFDMGVETVNQYNRKKVLQTGHKFGDVTVKFHDDNMSLINYLWQNYYYHYYADSAAAKIGGAYSRNATKKYDFILSKYGLDNGSIIPFFNYITIYQMARHEWVSAKLINPLIKSWDGQNLDYSSSKSRENTMIFSFEAVTYDSGSVSEGNPEGFGLEHYDNGPSPLTGQPIASASPSFATRLATNNRANLVAKLSQINENQNVQDLGTTTVQAATSQSSTGGLQGFNFPR